MNTLSTKPLVQSFVLACACIVWANPSQAAVMALDPLYLGTAPDGSVAGGLSGSWYKVDNNARFSNYQYTETDPGSPMAGQTAAIKTFSWGTGIWATSDIADIVAGNTPVTATAHSVGAVSYANNIYNNTVTSGAYGTWGEDYARTLAPIVAPPNACDVASQSTAACAGEQSYAAVFSGYLYVATSGSYDFGVFADDGFQFLLTGANASLGMGLGSVVNSPGRVEYSLLDKNNLDDLFLTQGYYGISLDYFNREQAGVIELGWKGPGLASAWTTIGDGSLYNQVPEPGSLALVALGLVGAWGVRQRRVPAGEPRS